MCGFVEQKRTAQLAFPVLKDLPFVISTHTRLVDIGKLVQLPKRDGIIQNSRRVKEKLLRCRRCLD